MFERLLLFGLVSVAMGACVAGAAATWYAARGTARFWRWVHAGRQCPGCQRLGRRCPWCEEELWRGAIILLAIVLPELAWPIMEWGTMPFTAAARRNAAAWTAIHLGLILALIVFL
jgi:hypothetical protein